MSDEEELEGSRMSLGEHLDELRRRVMISVIAIVIAFAGAWTFHLELGDLVFQPYERAAGMLNEELATRFAARVAEDPDSWPEYFTSADEATREVRVDKRVPATMRGDAASQGFFFYMRVCFMFALFVGAPVLLWQMWQFVAAGLYRAEKKVVLRYFPLSVVLFVSGVLFGFLVMVPYALFFLAKMTLEKIHYWETVGNYWTFLVGLTMALGVVFQLPVVMLALSRFGLVDPSAYSRYRGHFIVLSLVAAAILTPPDPFTQMMMAVPMLLLYELGNLLARSATESTTTDVSVPA